MSNTPEGKIKRKLDKVLKQEGVWFFNPQAGPFGRAGIPDKIACVNGQLVGIEVKSGPKHKPTRLQTVCMERIEAAGGKCFVVCDDETLHQLEVYIEENVFNAGS